MKHSSTWAEPIPTGPTPVWLLYGVILPYWNQRRAFFLLFFCICICISATRPNGVPYYIRPRTRAGIDVGAKDYYVKMRILKNRHTIHAQRFPGAGAERPIKLMAAIQALNGPTAGWGRRKLYVYILWTCSQYNIFVTRCCCQNFQKYYGGRCTSFRVGNRLCAHPVVVFCFILLIIKHTFIEHFENARIYSSIYKRIYTHACFLRACFHNFLFSSKSRAQWRKYGKMFREVKYTQTPPDDFFLN